MNNLPNADDVLTTPLEGQLSRAGSADLLARIGEIAESLGDDRIPTEARELLERVIQGRFYVACIGQFKRGKSTVICALVGDLVLPTGVIPVTAVATVLRFGKAKSARVRFRDGNWSPINVEDVGLFVSEEHNPENKKGVEGVEVFIPSPLLATGMCLVDTPGLGSVFAGNTAATQAFVPHIDAAIVVIGADPPIAGEELALLETVSRHVRDILLVMNKADRVSGQELEAASAFSRKMLEARLHRPFPEIYAVSAVESLERRGPARDWNKLTGALERLVDHSGQSLIRAAGERGVRRLGEQTLAIVREERAALLRPIEESEHRIKSMRQTIADAERSMHDLGYLFTAEQHRLSDLFLGRRKEFLKQTLPPARTELREKLKALPHRSGPGYRRDVLHAAQEIAKRYVTPWLEAEQAYAEGVYRQAAQRFVDFANDFLRKLAEGGVPELSQMPHALDAERGFRARSQFTFYDFITVAQPVSVFRFIGDLALGLAGAYGAFERDAEEFLDRLLETNSTRVQSDINDRITDSRHHLEADIRRLLTGVTQVAERALANAQSTRSSGSTAVESQLARFAALEQELSSMLVA